MAALRPPLVEHRNLLRIGRNGEDDGGRLFDLVGLAQNLLAVKLQTGVVAAAFGQCGHQLFGTAGFVEDGKPRAGFFLFLA